MLQISFSIFVLLLLLHQELLTSTSTQASLSQIVKSQISFGASDQPAYL